MKIVEFLMGILDSIIEIGLKTTQSRIKPQYFQVIEIILRYIKSI
ncbi:hypothetical protein PROVRUST_05897 [Providencia rustigianii DSM 4541]|uniref:Uncharacterized protein n=1 Tax=Providencia rustigianii DSM 4541 TaxID=500637 RepID=D1P179_9GAMM|nr:hypothetical protein PROVRUST_05897 [Providencia rustigianii DSM 4541]